MQPILIRRHSQFDEYAELRESILMKGLRIQERDFERGFFSERRLYVHERDYEAALTALQEAQRARACRIRQEHRKELRERWNGSALRWILHNLRKNAAIVSVSVAMLIILWTCWWAWFRFR